MRNLARRANQSRKPSVSSIDRSHSAILSTPKDTYPGAPATGAQFSYADVPVTAPPHPIGPTVIAADDPSERAADDVARQVMQKARPTPIASTRASFPIHPAPRGAEGNVAAAVRAASYPGAPLPREVRAYFEPRFAHDFSRVRVHADRQAANGAQALDALAYTLGDEIVFAPGKYEPATSVSIVNVDLIPARDAGGLRAIAGDILHEGPGHRALPRGYHNPQGRGVMSENVRDSAAEDQILFQSDEWDPVNAFLKSIVDDPTWNK